MCQLHHSPIPSLFEIYNNMNNVRLTKHSGSDDPLFPFASNVYHEGPFQRRLSALHQTSSSIDHGFVPSSGLLPSIARKTARSAALCSRSSTAQAASMTALSASSFDTSSGSPLCSGRQTRHRRRERRKWQKRTGKRLFKNTSC